MPRRGPTRSIRAEDHLAARILYEREKRTWSPSGLAHRMTQAGCPMNQTSVWKIEHGQPRRRITFDEAVAFAKVFELSLADLLQSPAEVVGSEAYGVMGRVNDLVRESGQMAMEAHDEWQRLDAALESEDVRSAIAGLLGGERRLHDWLRVIEDSANLAAVAWRDLWKRSAAAAQAADPGPDQEQKAAGDGEH